jgi:hypothetical protein
LKPIEKRIQALEGGPREPETGPFLLTWPEFSFAYYFLENFCKLYPDLEAAPRFLLAEYRRCEERFRRLHEQYESNHPDPDPADGETT